MIPNSKQTELDRKKRRFGQIHVQNIGILTKEARKQSETRVHTPFRRGTIINPLALVLTSVLAEKV